MAVIDLNQAGEQRTIASLSGGETFLMSLSLALALSELSSSQTRISTMFIDEGFGTLDTETLDQALSALEVVEYPDHANPRSGSAVWSGIIE